jgi:hypothetical protein
MSQYLIRVNLAANFSLFTKILADFISMIYLLTIMLKHTTKVIQQRL